MQHGDLSESTGVLGATAGTFNMHRLLKNSYFDSLGLVSLQDQYQRLQRVS